MRLLNAVLLQQILLLTTRLKDSSSADVEQASRRLACPQPTSVALTTFSFEYWIAVGSIGSLSVNVLPALDAYIVGQVEQKIEWCNQVDLMHLLSGQAERETGGASPLGPATAREGLGQYQGHRGLSVVSFVHSGLEYPSNCPCVQSPVINGANTTDVECHVAKGTLYFASCQDNVEYLCPIIRKALEETLAMDTPFMKDNDELSYLYYYGDSHEDSFSKLEICPQPDILTDNIGRRPLFGDSPMIYGESNTSNKTTPIVPADTPAQVVSSPTPKGEQADETAAEEMPGGQAGKPDPNSSSDTPSQTPTSSNNIMTPSEGQTAEVSAESSETTDAEVSAEPPDSPSSTIVEQELAGTSPDGPRPNSTESTLHANSTDTSSPSSFVDQAEIHSDEPSQLPSDIPSMLPSQYPSLIPSATPTLVPSDVPSFGPSQYPSLIPIATPTLVPSDLPSFGPSQYPSLIPSATPTLVPSDAPSFGPTSRHISNSLPLGLAPATFLSVIPSNIPLSTIKGISTPQTLGSSLPSFTPTVSSIPTESASPSFMENGRVVLIGPEIGDAVTAPEEAILVTQSEETDNFMAIGLGVGIPILLALLVGGYYAKTQPTTIEKPLDKDVQVVSTLSGLVGTGDPPGSFHEGTFHFMADGTRYLSTRCEECRTTRRNRSFVDNYLRTIHENETYDETMSLSLSSESTSSRPVNTHPTSFSATCIPISLQHQQSRNVHYCTSATCQKCNSSSPQKQPTTTFVSSPVWAAYPSNHGRLMRSFINEVENENDAGSYHSGASESSDSMISSWDHVRVVGGKGPNRISTTWEDEAEV